MKTEFKCCLCKKVGGWEFSYFHHFTPKMKHRYQCIYCRFDNDKVVIAKMRAEHKVFKKHMTFLKKLTGPNGGKFAAKYLKDMKVVKV